MVAAVNTYEIRTFKDQRWLTESRCNDPNEALAIANTLAGDRSFDGVKVVEEVYDEEEGLFREKTIFSYFKQDDKVFNPALDKKKKKDKPDVKSIIRKVDKSGVDVRAWLLVLGLLVSLGGNVALAIYLGDGNTKFAGGRRGDGTDFVVYDLPPVTMNYRAGDDTRAVKVRLGLELNRRDDVRAVENRLTQIINRVADDLSGLSDKDLEGKGSLNTLRKELHKGVQNAAGETPIEGVLFKEVTVF